ncbi:MAG: hypothetical protein V1664_01655 [Candidatus Uhrbacteria bacterium]
MTRSENKLPLKIQPKYWRNYFGAREIPYQLIHKKYPKLSEQIKNSIYRSIIFFIIELFSLIARTETVFPSASYKQNSMGDSTLKLEIKTDNLKLLMFYRNKLSDSWQSVNRESFSFYFEGHSYIFISLDVYMIGSGNLELSITNLDIDLIPTIENLAAKCFEKYQSLQTAEPVPFRVS